MTTLEQPAEKTWSGPDLHEVRRERSSTGGRPGGGLRRTLVALDLGATTFGWTAAFLLTVPRDARFSVVLLSLVAAVGLTEAMIAGQRLYLSRICAIRTVETSRLARAVALSAVCILALHSLAPVVASGPTVAVGTVSSFLLLGLVRSVFRSWLNGSRRKGRFLRLVVIVGANDEGYDLFRLVADHPETGFTVAGVAGDPERNLFPADLPRYSVGEELADQIRASGVNGVVVASSALHHRDLNRFVRQFLDLNIHVHLSSGLRGVDHRRLRSQPVAHEPLFYVEGMTLSAWQVTAKRSIDLVISVLVGIVSLPVLALAALAIKLDDGGPIFFRQHRPGRGMVPFSIVKLRTMRVGAEAFEPKRIDPTQGPRSKQANDPRRTRVGRILERTSIDELPQLWNVVRGDMSLVGPRPALLHEAQTFDEELQARFNVRPGMTGLWQVEARDNPSFSAYRRYDLFYIENWSVSLDFAILLATAQRVAMRGVDLILRRSSDEPAAVSPTVDLAAATD
jgi:exopolysaccharide biosynthesis polyprenyl glycosylphosphotransferase